MTEGARHPETDGTNFDFLGLTHVWGRSRNGKNMVRQVTADPRNPVAGREMKPVKAYVVELAEMRFPLGLEEDDAP